MAQYEWQPIETAPKDGTLVLLFIEDFHYVTVAWFCIATGLWPSNDAFNDDREPCNVGLPTHWMPLPAPPKRPQVTD
jgi:hypothetical protein